MNEIQHFIKSAQDAKIPVTSLLRQAKVLATKLAQTDQLLWIGKELGGYREDEQLPEYRIAQGILRGWNPFRGWIPLMFKNHKVEKTLSSRGTKQSIPEIEDLLESKSDEFEMPYPMSAANKILADNETKTKVSLFIPRSSLIGLTNYVRNALLEWAVNLDQKGVKGEELNFTENEIERASQVPSTISIGSIGSIHGSISGDSSNVDAKMTPAESFYSKFFWLVVVALVVVIVGNVISEVIIREIYMLYNVSAPGAEMESQSQND
ncbi:MAG TPA: hypothetical protein VJH91_01040 [Candidatus Paceibacterota bacterium]